MINSSIHTRLMNQHYRYEEFCKEVLLHHEKRFKDKKVKPCYKKRFSSFGGCWCYCGDCTEPGINADTLLEKVDPWFGVVSDQILTCLVPHISGINDVLGAILAPKFLE